MFLPLHDINPTVRPALVTGTLIALCAVVFMFWQLQVGMGASIAVGGMVPYLLAGVGAYDLAVQLPQVWGQYDPSMNLGWATVITHMFMHGGWIHILFNMYFLWMFGDNMEDVLGHGRFLVFYLICGVAAAAAHALIDGSAVPMVGASGAISGVMGGYVALFPAAQVRTLLLMGVFSQIILVPAWLLVAFWFGRDVLSWLVADGSGVAHMAHIGGFVAGWVLVKTRLLDNRKAGPWG